MGPVHGFICADDRGLTAQIDISPTFQKCLSKFRVLVSEITFGKYFVNLYCKMSTAVLRIHITVSLCFRHSLCSCS